MPKPTELGASEQGRTAEQHKTASETGDKACYMYCVVDGAHKVEMGPIGLGEASVCTLPFQQISAVVHACAAAPYESVDREQVERWVRRHQEVVETAIDRLGSVLPMSFDMLIRNGEGASAEQNVIRWLENNYDSLREKLARVRGKSEYGVEICWEAKPVAEAILREDPELRLLSQKIESKDRGAAYLLRQKLEKLLRTRMEAKADSDFKDFYGRIHALATEVRVNRPRKATEEEHMILNVACLLEPDSARALGDLLDEICAAPSYRVRFTGPWPPYHFV